MARDRYCKKFGYKIDSSSFFIVSESDEKITYHVACYTKNHELKFIKDKRTKRKINGKR